MNSRILSQNTRNMCDICTCDNGRDFFPLVKKRKKRKKENRKRRLSVEVNASNAKRSWRPRWRITILQQSRTAESREPQSSVDISHSRDIYAPRYYSERWKILSRRRWNITLCQDARIACTARTIIYRWPRGWLETDNSYCSREGNTSEVTMKSATGEIPPPPPA